MNRRPSLRSWLRTAQRWYSSARVRRRRNLDGAAACGRWSPRSLRWQAICPERLRTNALELVRRHAASAGARARPAPGSAAARAAARGLGRDGSTPTRAARPDAVSSPPRSSAPTGVQHRRRPAHQATVGVADQRRCVCPSARTRPCGVTGQRPPVVAARRFVAAAVAAQVDGHHAGTGQAAQLMSPRPPERAEPVQQDDQRPSVGFDWSSAPARRLASTTWKRIPLACMSRCRHGPPMRTIDGSGRCRITSPTGRRSTPADGIRRPRSPWPVLSLPGSQGHPGSP